MNDRDAPEMADAKVTIAEGYVGNLTEEQHSALVRMWESYFDICDRARGNASRGEGFQETKTGTDLKKSGIPDDDAGKDEAKRLQEQQGMNELMETYGPEALRDSWWQFVRGDHPDANMLRFIRARKGDVGRGLAMMATCLKWRLDTDVESFILKGDLTNGKEIPKFIEQQKSGKVFSLGCTAKEQPICYVIMKYHSMFAQPAASMQKFIVTQMETFRLLIHPPNDKATIFFDLKGFGLKQMDVVSLLYLVKVLESYYPESLGTMYISNAPLIFWGFWRAVKNLLDPVVRNKIKFIANAGDTEGDVPEEQMIVYCGGTVETEFDFVDAREGENAPQEDEGRKEQLLQRHRRITDKYEEVTRAWCKEGGKDEELQRQRDVLTKKLRLSQFELEPYTRGLTAYHRNGVLPPESTGISVFDYKLKNGEVHRQVLGKRSCRKSTERELYEIAKNRKTAEEASQVVQKQIDDGSWGEWRINDNSDEVKRVALASLEDLDNSGELKTEGVDPNGTSEVAASQVPKNVLEAYRKTAKTQTHDAPPQTNGSAAPQERDSSNAAVAAGAGGAAAAGGAGAAAAASKSNGTTAANQKTDEGAALDTSEPAAKTVATTGTAGQETGAQMSTTGAANHNLNTTDPNAPIQGGNNPNRPRGKSASQGPARNGGTTNYAKEEAPAKGGGGLFATIKSKIMT